jgi:hypothetical protein
VRGIRSSLAHETLAAVDRYEPDYQRAIRSLRPHGPEPGRGSIITFILRRVLARHAP